MARGRRKSDNESDSSESSSGSSSSSSSSSDESSGKSSGDRSPDLKERKKTSRNERSRQSSRKKVRERGGDKSSPRHKRAPRSPSQSPPPESPRKHEKGKPRSPPGSPPSETRKQLEDTHMARFGEGRSADELSIGAGDSDDEYRDELAQEISTQETSKKSKSRREGLSSGEVTPEEESGEVSAEEGDSDDSYSWRESRVRTMLQSHVQKPSDDEPHRESYDRYDSDHEGGQPFRSVVGTTITRPGQRVSDSDDGEIIDTDEEQERKKSRDKYSRSSPKRHSKEERRHRPKDASTSRRHGDRQGSDRRKSDHDARKDRKRSRRRSETKEDSPERTEDRKEKEKEKRKEDKEEQYEDAKVKFRKRVWDQKEEEWKGKRKVPDSPRPEDDDKPQEAEKENAEPPAPKKKKEDTLTTRTGGAYIPPAKLRMMQAQITDKTSEAYQRMSWEALKKSINGLINKVNVPNIGMIVQELLQLNIVRGRGLLSRSIIAAQTASPTFTHVYAALVAIINTKFPQNGELLLRRLIINFKKGFRRNDKTLCLSSTRFIAHLVNQQVAHEIIALEILTLLLETVTDDSVEVAVGFVKECGLKLQEVSPRGIHAIFERMRSILHEAQIDKRVQYMVEVVFANRKDGFKDYPTVIPELDLVEESDQFTHMLTLEDNYQDENILNVFKLDPDYVENEEKYKAIKKEILDEGSDDSDSDDESGEASSSDDSDEAQEEQKMEIIDQTETNLVALRRTIYLTIQSSLDFEECAHKMLKMDFKPGQEREVCNMILDCCALQRTYEKFFGLLAQRFCQLKREYVTEYEAIFPEQYSTCHRLDTNKLRNVAKLFAHLLHTDAISWTVLECVRMNEEDTTSSSRIFIKIMFLELSEFMGLPKLNGRLQDKTLQPYFEGLLPRDNPANTRFAINFFTTIGLGGLTDELRDHLKNVQRQIMQQRQPVQPSDSSSSSSSESESSSSSSSSSDSSSDSSSESSDSDRDRKKKKKKAVKESSKKSASRKKDSKEKENHKGKENGGARNKERARQEERPRQDEKVNRRDRIENDIDGRGKRRGGSREMEDSRPRYNNERGRTEMRGRQNDSRSNYANHDDERDHEKHTRNNRDEKYTRNEDRDFRQSRNEDRDVRQEERDSRQSRNEDRDARYGRDEERDPRQSRNERDSRQTRNEERDARYTKNEDRDARYTKNDDRDSRQARNEERDSRPARHEDRDARYSKNEERDEKQSRNEDRDPRQTSIRNEERTREKQKNDKRVDRNADRQQNSKERQPKNAKHSKQQEESDSSDSDSSSSEESSSSESSSSSSSESESSMDASPPREKQGKPGKNNPRGRAQDVRENFSDKENQRNKQRTRNDSSSDSYQKYNEPNLTRHNSQNNEYNDINRQGRDERWDGRRNVDNQYGRGGPPRTRYNSRGEEDYMNNARNKDYHRGYDRMEVDGYDRRNDRGRGRYENDKPPPPRYNERDRYDGDRGSRYDRY